MKKTIARWLRFFDFIIWRLQPVVPVVIIVLVLLMGRGYATMAVVTPPDGYVPRAAVEATPQQQPLPPTAVAQPEVAAPPAPVYPDIRILVNIPATELTLYENGIPIFTKPIAIGSGVYPTPEQESEITRIEWNPWWYPPPGAAWAAGEKPHPPGKGNPLGPVKMPISQAILFHGTNKEWTVGRPASHGCMRMYNADAQELAWYLQSRLSQKNDEGLRETYKKHSKTTYVVQLDAPVPVRLDYEPVLVRNDALVMYPDYYGRLGRNRKAAVIERLVAASIALESIDDAKVTELIKKWPKQMTETPISSLLISTGEAVATIEPPVQP